MNKVILITGTSMGFGRTAAETLAQCGCKVFATMRETSGRNGSIAEAFRSLAKREGWNLVRWVSPKLTPPNSFSSCLT